MSTALLSLVLLVAWPWRVEATLKATTQEAVVSLAGGLGAGHFRDQPDSYMDGPIRAGVVATMLWGIVGMSAGVFAALQLSWPNVFYFPEAGWLNFGRIRPVHTSGVVFAFGQLSAYRLRINRLTPFEFQRRGLLAVAQGDVVPFV